MSFDEARSEVGFVGGEVEAGGRVDWREADRQLRRIAKRRAGLDAEEAQWLLAAQRAEVHVQLGCSTFADYVERVLGYGPRVCADRLRVARALEDLISIRAALAAGELSYSAVRELVRVATPSTEDAWLDDARGKTVREIEERVAGHQPGDLPDDPTDPDLRPCVLRFEVTPATFALWRDAEQRVLAEAGHMLTDDEIVDAMARAVLTPTGAESNRPPYQIALSVCPACERGRQDGAGRAIEVHPNVLDTAHCDAQTLGRVDGNTRTRASRTIPPALRRQVLRRDHHRCIVPGCRASRWIQVHHLELRSQGGANEADNLVALCHAHHRALHDNRLSITGAPGARTFGNGNGTPWGTSPIHGEPARPTWVATSTADTVRAALRQLGFKPAEAAAAAAHATTHAGASPTLEELLRTALQACRPRTS